jgi:hypothetical protein
LLLQEELQDGKKSVRFFRLMLKSPERHQRGLETASVNLHLVDAQQAPYLIAWCYSCSYAVG